MHKELEPEVKRFHESEADFQHHAALYHRILDSLPDLVCCFRADGTLTFVNRAYCEYFGKSSTDLLGRSFLQLIPESDRIIPLQKISFLGQTKGSTRYEYRVIRADGSLRWHEWTDQAVCDGVGEVIEFQSIGRDITDHKLTETQLRQSEAMLAGAQKVAHVGSWEFDLTTRKITWSEEVFRILGLQPTQPEPSYEEYVEYVHPEDRASFQQLAEQTIAIGESCELDFRVIRTDGAVRHLNGRAKAVLSTDGQVMRLFGTVQDITDRKQTEEVLRSQAEREHLVSLITQHIHQSLHLDEILNTTVAEVRQFLQVDRVIIYRFTGDAEGCIIVESVDPAWDSILGSRVFNPCLAVKQSWELYQHGGFQAISDIDASDLNPCYVDMLSQLQVKANLVIPILLSSQPNAESSFAGSTEGALWGLLVAQHCQGPRAWRSQEIDLLKQLATQTGIATQQSELYQQVQQLNANLEQQVQERTAQLQLAFELESALKRITDKVRDSLDENQILESAVAELAKAFGASCCNAALFNLVTGTSTIRYEYTTSVSPLQGRVTRLAAFPEIYDQLLQGQYFQFCDLQADSLRGRVAMLCCPILDGEGVLGDLRLIDVPSAQFSDQQIRLVQQVANQCAIALRQAHLYQTAQTQVMELERLNRLKDDFLSTISHELRTPMSSIKMAIEMLELLLFGDGDLGEARSQVGDAWDGQPEVGLQARSFRSGGSRSRLDLYFQVLKDECQKEIRLINDLLDLSRLNAETEPLMLSTMAARPWILHISEPFVDRALNQHQALQFDLPMELPFLTTDFFYLERILTELLNNACKYTPTGGAISVSAQASKTHLYFRVTNSGIEIAPTEQARIFERFYRIPNDDPWRYSGTGLGLALVKKRVEQLHGTITVTSGEGQTTFTVSLPLIQA